MLYLLLIIIAIGVLLISPEGKKILKGTGITIIFLTFWGIIAIIIAWAFRSQIRNIYAIATTTILGGEATTYDTATTLIINTCIIIIICAIAIAIGKLSDKLNK